MVATTTHVLPNGKVALTIEDNLDAFEDSPTFSRMVAYGNPTSLDIQNETDWLWIHKDFKP